MRGIVLILLVLFSYTGSFAQSSIQAVDAAMLNQRVTHPDTVYIVNYWATWCIPCIKELPYFESIQKKYSNKPVKVLLVSFDFKEQYPEKLEQWVTTKKLQCEVLWFSEPKPNDFIPKLNKNWSGALPATTITYKKKNFYQFTEETVTESTLEGILNNLL